MALDTGKTHGRHMRLYIDGLDISGDMRSIGSFGMSFEEVDMHCVPDGVIYYQLGEARQFIDGFQAVLSNIATTGSHEELKTLEEYIIMLPIGIKGAPTSPSAGDVGDPCFCAVLQQSSILTEMSGPVLISASFNGPSPIIGASMIGTSANWLQKVWGHLLYAKTQVAATTTGNYIDDTGAAGASYGGVGFLQVFEAETTGTWAFVIQDSPDHSAWATLLTFDADGTAVLGEAEATTLTTAVDRYLRILATYSGGGSDNMTFACAFVRYRELKTE